MTPTNTPSMGVERENVFDPDVAEAFNRRVEARALAGDPLAINLIQAFQDALTPKDKTNV